MAVAELLFNNLMSSERLFTIDLIYFLTLQIHIVLRGFGVLGFWGPHL